VVTTFTLNAFEQPFFWGGGSFYPIQTGDAHIAPFVNYTNNLKNDPFASVIHTRIFDSTANRSLIVNFYHYTKPEANAPIFDEFRAIQPVLLNTARIGPLSGFTTEIGAGIRPNARYIPHLHTFKSQFVL
jgi:hypothetical protein